LTGNETAQDLDLGFEEQRRQPLELVGGKRTAMITRALGFSQEAAGFQVSVPIKEELYRRASAGKQYEREWGQKALLDFYGAKWQVKVQRHAGFAFHGGVGYSVSNAYRPLRASKGGPLMPTIGSTPVFTSDEASARLQHAVHAKAVNFHAMYSSVMGGIITDPAFMVLPLDDHMVHRGHAVFDTAMIVNGKLYQLDAHLERLLRSAEMARLPLPHTPDQLRQIIIDTAAASRQRDASVRYWLSAGPGGFGLAPGECVSSSFYVMIFRAQPEPERSYTEGVKVVTSTVPIKPPFFARVKSTNYLPNALVIMEAKDHGADNGIFIDHRGMVGESSNMNVACVTHDRVLWHPAFDAILTGITVQRVLQLAQRLVEQGDLRAIKVAELPVAEARTAAEMLMLGSSIKVAPVVQWDGHPIGDGKPGPITKKLLDLWQADTLDADQLLPVPYPTV
jgi:4-amino-4-deoxychorismate lyase